MKLNRNGGCITRHGFRRPFRESDSTARPYRSSEDRVATYAADDGADRIDRGNRGMHSDFVPAPAPMFSGLQHLQGCIRIVVRSPNPTSGCSFPFLFDGHLTFRILDNHSPETGPVGLCPRLGLLSATP